MPCGAAVLPRPAHVVIVVEENRSLAQIDSNPDAPYLNGLIRGGALFTDSHGVTHPSLPNYLALFSGRTNDNGDGCPATGLPTEAPNLGSELLAAHRTFGAYSESLPERGWSGCAAGTYARKHAPWVHFSNVPANVQLPFDALRSYAALPTVAFIVPNVDDDMHDGTIKEGDAWLAQHLAPLVTWAAAHDTLVVITWDEGYDRANTVPTILLGSMVKPGRYAEHITHYTILRTIEDLYRLPHAGRSAKVGPITDCWR